MDLTTGDLLALFAVIITPKEVFSILCLSIASSIDNNYFSILDHASTTFQLKKKPFIFNWKNLRLIINFIMLI